MLILSVPRMRALKQVFCTLALIFQLSHTPNFKRTCCAATVDHAETRWCGRGVKTKEEQSVTSSSCVR